MIFRNSLEDDLKVFDFNSKPEAEKKAGEKTYTLFKSDCEELSKEDPIMVLSDPDEIMLHHQLGVFTNPSKKTGFRFDKDGDRYETEILSMDSRFEKLYIWLANSSTNLKLSGRPTKDGYAVYRIHAVSMTGEIRSETDSFVQLVIQRLLSSEIDEEEIDNPDEDVEEENENLILTDINSMADFIACAGNVLPSDIRKWATRNLAIQRSTAISHDERRHAQRALSMMLNIQWKGSYFESIDPVAARKILDEELFGMDKVKQRIIETIIQINRTHTLPAYGLLLAGPAGVGKSQLAYAVAKILKLPWTSLDMSTIHDIEALTGSPRVYSNAKPGLIMEAFSRAGASNLVFIINELDKADSKTAAGNPADALLTLLDNIGYTDNYIECMIPTSGVYPIATANEKNRISDPIMSRFAVLDIPDYTPDEKKLIFQRFSLPKVLKRMSMREDECIIGEDALSLIIEKCTGTTGCRDLEQSAEHFAANALYQIETKGKRVVKYDKESARRVLEM